MTTRTMYRFTMDTGTQVIASTADPRAYVRGLDVHGRYGEVEYWEPMDAPAGRTLAELFGKIEAEEVA